MTETKRYVVTMPGCCHYAVGDVVDLSDEKARAFVGKVKPAPSQAERQDEVSDAVAPSQDQTETKPQAEIQKPKRGRPKKS